MPWNIYWYYDPRYNLRWGHNINGHLLILWKQGYSIMKAWTIWLPFTISMLILWKHDQSIMKAWTIWLPFAISMLILWKVDNLASFHNINVDIVTPGKIYAGVTISMVIVSRLLIIRKHHPRYCNSSKLSLTRLKTFSPTSRCQTIDYVKPVVPLLWKEICIDWNI